MTFDLFLYTRPRRRDGYELAFLAGAMACVGARVRRASAVGQLLVGYGVRWDGETATAECMMQ